MSDFERGLLFIMWLLGWCAVGWYVGVLFR